MRFHQKIVIGLTLSAFFAFIPHSVRANTDDFTTTLKTMYAVQDDGSTLITHQFAIQNKQPLLTITQYGLKVGSHHISDVTVFSQGKAIKPEVVTNENQTSIGITFPDKVVGQGKVRNFEISYLDPDAAFVSGKVLEVAVPRLENVDAYDAYEVELVTPPQFGSPTRVTPAQYETRSSPTKVTTKFAALHGESVIALFGDEQIFELTLVYHLENPHSDSRLVQLALPPDTSFQQVYYHSLDPKPTEIERDYDGNWIATYLLPPNSTTQITATVQVAVTLEPNVAIPMASPTSHLTAKQTYWETDNALIQQIATQQQTPRAIYDYVVDNLSYNYDLLESDVTRQGAATALANPEEALCQEFTDSFVALARAAHIPSRRITGYAHTENQVLRPLSFVQDILHAWPEYYDSERQLWIPIDPTWDITSGGINYFDQFDLNHVVFAINGRDSERPYPAGSYKTPDQKTKDLEVSFGTERIEVAPALAFSSEVHRLLDHFNLPMQTDILVTNQTGRALYNPIIVIKTENPATFVDPADIIELEYLLPYQEQKLPISVQTNNLFTPEKTKVTVTHDQKETEFTIYAFPQIWNFIAGPELLLTVGIVCLLTAFGSWGVLVRKRKK